MARFANRSAPRSRCLATLTLGVCLVAASCNGGTPGPPGKPADSRPPNRSVDSRAVQAGTIAPIERVEPDTVSIESALAHFRSTLASRPVGLENGAPTRESLVRRIVSALAASDTNALRAIAVSRAEYAWLIYPESPLLHPPYRQPIDIAWMLHAAPHAKGFARLLERLGGRPLRLESLTCDPAPVTQGANRFWTGCTARLAVGPGAFEMRLFTALVERDGIFKVMSYDNDF